MSRSHKCIAPRQLVGSAGGNLGHDAVSVRSCFDSSTDMPRSQRPRYGHIIDGGRVWLKRVRASKHMRQRPFAGWAADVSDALAARALGVEWLRLDDVETGRRYWASVNELCYRGQLFDYGFGKQVCLALDRWQVGPNPPETESEPEAALQPPLF